MAVPANFQLNSALPFYPAGNTTGATLTLTQSPCNDPYKRPACCGPAHHGRMPSCANWTGAHLVSRGCILYGTLTAEMAMLMPEGSRAFLDVGTYVRGGTPDATQNELDMIFRTLAVDVVSSSDSAGAAAGNTSFVASTWDATFFNPGEQKQVFGPNSWPHYTGFMARQYHNYSIIWTPHSITWALDKVVYRKVTRLRRCQHRRCWGVPTVTLIPWRPQTIRVILRTSQGNTLAQQPDCTVFLRRLSYTPLPGRRREHAHPIRFFLRQLLLLFILAVVGGGVLRWVWAAMVGNGTIAGDDDLSEAERRRRMEMTPLLSARAA